MAVLVTGGAGYIGSHTCVELLSMGEEVVVVDNLANSKVECVRRVEDITGKSVSFYSADIRNKELLRQVFGRHSITSVIHFAGSKAVGESVLRPLSYYENNVAGTVALCQVMQEFGVKNLIFSSSATVYDKEEKLPLTEEAKLSASSPYGWSKLMTEQILNDLAASDSRWSIVLLRYFNPIGAHKSGAIGEDPTGVPNNLMPYITQVAAGKRKNLQVFGDCYPTKDGTGVRDYIHVVDLAKGHVAAVSFAHGTSGVHVFNLGTGKGYSVLELLAAFEQATDTRIPYVITDKRPGDVAVSYSDPTKAEEELGWKAEIGIEEMCEDAWRWQSSNPDGYR